MSNVTPMTYEVPRGPYQMQDDGPYHGVNGLFKFWKEQGKGKKVLVSLSGGMDSTTLAYFARECFDEAKFISFDYGSKHNPYEEQALERLSSDLGTIPRIDLHPAFGSIQSHLMATGGDIPTGHYEQSNMSQTVIPGRNLIMASVLAGIAESEGCDYVFLGTHNGDHAIYPDCRASFIDAADGAVRQSSDGRVGVAAPFIHMDKESILVVGMHIGVPYRNTRTCYSPGPVSCGKCGACVERLEAFNAYGQVDPLEYMDRKFWREQIFPEGETETQELPSGGFMTYIKGLFGGK